MRNFLLRVCHLWSFTATCGFLFQCRGQPCVRSEQRQGPPGTGQSCSDSPRHPEDHVLRLSRSPPPPHHHLRAFPPGHIHPPSHPGRQVHVVCQPRSPHSCKSCIPPPPAATHLVKPDLTLCRGKQGGTMGKERQNPHTGLRMQTLLLKTNQRQTRHYYAISNQPTTLLSTLIGPHPHHPPC